MRQAVKGWLCIRMPGWQGYAQQDVFITSAAACLLAIQAMESSQLQFCYWFRSNVSGAEICQPSKEF